MPRIRIATPADAEALLAIYAPLVRDTTVSFETKVPAQDTFAKRISTVLTTKPWLVWEEDSRVRGYAYASTHRERCAYQWSVEVAVYTASSVKRCGIGRRLYLTLFDILRLQAYRNAYAAIALPNPASIAFHQALGFERFAIYKRAGFKLGRWHDVGWWQLRLIDDNVEPDAPIPLPDLFASGACDRCLERANGNLQQTD